MSSNIAPPIARRDELVALYQGSGREREAVPYLKRIRRHQKRNPFHHFRLGREAAGRDDLRTARKRLRRAVRLLPDDVMFRAELGKIQLRSERPRRAERSFRKALGLASSESQRAGLERLIESIRSGAA